MSRLWLPSNEVIVPQRRSRRPAPGMLAAMGHVGGCCCVSTPEPCTDESFWAFWESVTGIEFDVTYFLDRYYYANCVGSGVFVENDTFNFTETATLFFPDATQRTYAYTEPAPTQANCCGGGAGHKFEGDVKACTLKVVRASKSIEIVIDSPYSTRYLGVCADPDPGIVVDSLAFDQTSPHQWDCGDTEDEVIADNYFGINPAFTGVSLDITGLTYST